MPASKKELISLCRNGDVDKVRQLVRDGVSANVEVDGMTPLMATILNDHDAVVSFLLDEKVLYSKLSDNVHVCYEEQCSLECCITRF
jgi:ankyrin repeat protein